MPLIASRAADSAFALGFGKSSSISGYSSWVTNLTFSTLYGAPDVCTDSSGNSYQTISLVNGTYIQKTSSSGNVVWQKYVSTTSIQVLNGKIAISPDETILYVAQCTNKYNSSNYCIELNKIYTSNGNLIASGVAYFASGRTTELHSFTYNANATDGKNLVFTLGGQYAASPYTTALCAVSVFVNPSDFGSYRVSQACAAGTNNTQSMNATSSVTLFGGTTFMLVQSSLYGYGVIGINTSGETIGAIKLQGTGMCVATSENNSYAYCSFFTTNGRIGIAKISSTLGFQWAKELVITGSTATAQYTQEKNVFVDSDGNVYCCTAQKNGATNIYVVVFKMDSSGNVQWIKKFITTYGQPQSGPLWASSIYGKGNLLTVGGVFSGTANAGFNITLNKNGTNIDGTYIGNSSIGNMIVSTPDYTVNTISDAGGFSYLTLTTETLSLVTTTNVTSSSDSTSVYNLLLPYA